MKKILHLFIFIFLSLGVACTGPKVVQDFDPSADFTHLKTYHWRSQEKQEPENALIDKRLHIAIDNTLKQKGYRRIYGGQGDFSVSYHYQVVRDFDSPDLHTGVGIGGGSSGVYGGIGIGAFGLGGRRDEAILTINIWDGPSGRLIWQGSNTRRLPTSGDAATAAAHNLSQAEDILAEFPPLPQ
jgi:hypothetical protein